MHVAGESAGERHSDATCNSLRVPSSPYVDGSWAFWRVPLCFISKGHPEVTSKRCGEYEVRYLPFLLFLMSLLTTYEIGFSVGSQTVLSITILMDLLIAAHSSEQYN